MGVMSRASERSNLVLQPRRPPAALVRHDAALVDWSSWFLTDEADMGESYEHGEMIRLLLSCLDVLADERGWTGRLWASDQFFAWRPEHPLVRVSPDVYVLDDPPPPPRPASWRTWVPGHRPPTMAIEIVSEDWRKDYQDAPAKYWQLGCAELIVFDPDAVSASVSLGERVPLQLYRLDADGAYVQVHAGSTPVRCEAIDAYFIVVTDGATVRLRIARDAAGHDLVPSLAEAREQSRARVRELEARLASLDSDDRS